MADPHIFSTLNAKRRQIETHIKGLEKHLAQAKHDLAHVNATIRLFEVDGKQLQFPAYVSFRTLFKRGEVFDLCKQAIAASPDGTTTSRDIAAYIIAQKGWDASDRALAVSVGHTVITVMGERFRRGLVEKVGKRAGAVVWRMA
jgi:hypothetical protein